MSTFDQLYFFQINGIALDNKSLSECEALLRNCRDSLSVSLIKVTDFLSALGTRKTYKRLLRSQFI